MLYSRDFSTAFSEWRKFRAVKFLSAGSFARIAMLGVPCHEDVPCFQPRSACPPLRWHCLPPPALPWRRRLPPSASTTPIAAGPIPTVARHGYEPYADKRGLYTSYWAPFMRAVNSVWLGHMAGKVDLQEAAKEMVDILPAK
jgi:hypothetical protein